MIPDTITFPAKTMATVRAQKTVTVTQKALNIAVSSIDFSKITWTDSAGKLVAIYPGIPAVDIMGGDSSAAYNAAWTEDDARTAFLARLALAVPAVLPAPGNPS